MTKWWYRVELEQLHPVQSSWTGDMYCNIKHIYYCIVSILTRLNSNFKDLTLLSGWDVISILHNLLKWLLELCEPWHWSKKAKHFVKESLLTFSACKQHVVFRQAELRQTIMCNLKKECCMRIWNISMVSTYSKSVVSNLVLLQATKQTEKKRKENAFCAMWANCQTPISKNPF